MPGIIQVKRKQFPVGQGGMHAEIVTFGGKQVVMVYDCGSVSGKKDNKKKPIEREIDKLKKFIGTGEKEIDYLILSHLHNDHINGVSYLKKQGWKVKHLVLPYTTPQEKFFYAAGLIENSAGDELVSFVLNPNGYFGEQSKLIEIGNAVEATPDTREDDASSDNELPRLDNQSGRIAQGAYVTTTSQCDWGVALFNYRNQDIATWITQNFPSALPEKIEEWGVEKKKIAVDAYKAALENFGAQNFNLTSLCAFSGCLNSRCCGIRPAKDRCQHGWIHTGDILLSGDCLDKFNKFFNHYFEQTRVVQIPHHGAINGYGDFAIKPNTTVVVCAGTHNRYGHPKMIVLHKLQKQQGRFIFVADEVNTDYQENICVWCGRVDNPVCQKPCVTCDQLYCF